MTVVVVVMEATLPLQGAVSRNGEKRFSIVRLASAPPAHIQELLIPVFETHLCALPSLVLFAGRRMLRPCHCHFGTKSHIVGLKRYGVETWGGETQDGETRELAPLVKPLSLTHNNPSSQRRLNRPIRIGSRNATVSGTTTVGSKTVAMFEGFGLSAMQRLI